MKIRKLKTKKALSRRIRITKTGKVLRLSSFARHLKRKKSKKQLRRLKGSQEITGRLANKIKKLL